MVDTEDIMDMLAHTVMATMERDLLMLSPLPKPLPTLRPRLILGTDTTDMVVIGVDTGDIIAHTVIMATMERDLLMLSLLPKLLPALRLRLILGTDTTDMVDMVTMPTGHTDMDTMDTAHTDMLTGVKLKPTTTCCFSLPTLL